MIANGVTDASGALEVAIVGAGIGGLTAAIALRRAGHRVTVYEQSRLKSEFGAAINVPPNAYGILKRLGVDPVEKGAVEMKWFTEYSKTGSWVKPHDFTEKGKIWQHKYILAHRVDLHAQLKETAISRDGAGIPVDLVTGASVADVDVESTMLMFKDGTKVKAHLIVGADGVHSVCRTKLTDAQPFPSGKSAYRFTLERDEVRKDAKLAPVVERPGEMVFWSGADRRIVMYPTRDNKLLNFVVMVPDRAADIGEKTWNKPGSRDDMVAYFDGFDERALGLLRMAKTADLKIWTLTDMGPVDNWHTKNFCLIGDAAHPFLPHQGQGGAQAMEDGVALGVLLPHGTTPREVPERLELYQRCRKPRAEYVQEVTRRSGADEGVDHKIDVEAVMTFFEYNCGHDEFHSATRILRDWMYKEKSKVRWRMPISFGPNQSPWQGFQGQHLSADDSSFETIRIRFKTSRTLLQNLLPSPAFSFDHPDTLAEASWVVTTLDNLKWLGGTGYHYFALYLHGVQYKKQDGSVLKGDFLAVMVEDLTDPILTGREEIGFPKLYSEINIQKTATSWQMEANWRGATYLKLNLNNPELQQQSKTTASADTLVYKYIPATGRPGYADAEYAICAPVLQKQTVSSFQTTEECSIETFVHDEQKLPTLHHVAKGIDELPIYEIIGGTVTAGKGVDDFSAAYRIE